SQSHVRLAGLCAQGTVEERSLRKEGRMSAKHAVFVLDIEGKPLAPTTPARARKLLQAGVAEKRWSKFGTFGLRMLVPTRRETPRTALGIDQGTKFEGYAVVCGEE